MKTTDRLMQLTILGSLITTAVVVVYALIKGAQIAMKAVRILMENW